MAGAFPIGVEGLTKDRLNELLRTIDPAAEVNDFTITEVKTWGDGKNQVSTAGRIELDLDLRQANGPAHREKIVIKVARPDIPAQPLYRNEVAFYTRLRRELDIEAPRPLGGEFDADSGTFGLALENLRERGTVFPNVKLPVTQPHMRSLLDTLATLHAHFWESPRFREELDFVEPHTSGSIYRFFNHRDMVPALVRDEYETEQFKREMVEAAGRTLDDLYDEFRKVQHHQASLPQTLCHGDTHIGNTYLLPNGQAGLIDWQLMARGYFMHDISYIMVTALSVKDRRQHEKELLAFYLERLRAKGVANPPDFETAWYEYRLAAIWGVYIGWLTTPIENYGWDITVCNHIRLLTAYQDLGTSALVATLPPAPLPPS